MKSIKSLTIWTIILNLFILIGSGHGIAFLGLFEAVSVYNLCNSRIGKFSFSFIASYEDIIRFLVVISLPGLIFLLLSLFIKQQTAKLIFRMIGILFLWIGFFYLSHYGFKDQTSQLSFFSSMPFFIVSILLVCRIVKFRPSKT